MKKRILIPALLGFISIFIGIALPLKDFVFFCTLAKCLLGISVIQIIPAVYLDTFVVTPTKNQGKVQMDISQNPLSLKTFICARFMKNSKDLFTVNALNLMSKCSRNVKTTSYKCLSHAYTYRILQRLEKENYIKNLSYEPSCPLNLTLFRKAYKLQRRDKPIPMRSIIFECSGRIIGQEDLKKMMDYFNISHAIFYPKGSTIKIKKREMIRSYIDRRKQIEELKKERDTLISNSKENEKKYIKRK